ncbi:MAG: substrate-binding domain-containing protein [Actinobacteria bacterium]|nr:substrate-binding domain-containing protein [Actinomycetota bacterium]
MGSKKTPGVLIGLILIVATAVALAGCGGSSGSSGSSSEPKGGEGSGGEAKEASAGGTDNVAAAKKVLAPYIGQYYPEFPVEEPLKEKPSPDVQISAMQESSAIGGLLVELMEGAAKTAGVKLTAVKAGATASTAQAAAETVVSQNPDGFYLPPFEPSTIGPQLEQMEENEIPVVMSGGPAEAENYPAIVANLVPPSQDESYGEIMAAWAVMKHGAEAHPVLIEHPELAFSKAIKAGFESGMKEFCPECKFEILPITAEEVSQSANKIVSELQAKPDINQIVAISDFVAGLPAAQKAAGLEVGTFVYPGEPQTFEAIKNGEIEAALAAGLGTQSYTVMDILLREIQGQPLTPAEKKGWQPMQILEKKDITFDPKYGWEADPNYIERFAKYWHVEK